MCSTIHSYVAHFFPHSCVAFYDSFTCSFFFFEHSWVACFFVYNTRGVEGQRKKEHAQRVNTNNSAGTYESTNFGSNYSTGFHYAIFKKDFGNELLCTWMDCLIPLYWVFCLSWFAVDTHKERTRAKIEHAQRKNTHKERTHTEKEHAHVHIYTHIHMHTHTHTSSGVMSREWVTTWRLVARLHDWCTPTNEYAALRVMSIVV